MCWFSAYGFAFLVIAAVTGFFSGPIGILYAFGFMVFFGLIHVLAELGKAPPDQVTALRNGPAPVSCR
jgi:hypothetical protein